MAHFGTATLDVIETDAGAADRGPGLGPKRTKLIAAAWVEQKAIKEVMVFLQVGRASPPPSPCGSTRSTATRRSSVVSKEPYRLASDVWGIGFKTADAIAGPWASRTTAPSG